MVEKLWIIDQQEVLQVAAEPRANDYWYVPSLRLSLTDVFTTKAEALAVLHSQLGRQIARLTAKRMEVYAELSRIHLLYNVRADVGAF